MHSRGVQLYMLPAVCFMVKPVGKPDALCCEPGYVVKCIWFPGFIERIPIFHHIIRCRRNLQSLQKGHQIPIGMPFGCTLNPRVLRGDCASLQRLERLFPSDIPPDQRQEDRLYASEER